MTISYYIIIIIITLHGVFSLIWLAATLAYRKINCRVIHLLNGVQFPEDNFATLMTHRSFYVLEQNLA